LKLEFSNSLRPSDEVLLIQFSNPEQIVSMVRNDSSNEFAETYKSQETPLQGSEISVTKSTVLAIASSQITRAKVRN